MFDHFTFGAPAHSEVDRYRAVSPCDTSCPSPLPSLPAQNITEASTSNVPGLACQFDEIQPQSDDIYSSHIFSLRSTLATADETVPIVDDEYPKRPQSAPSSPIALSHHHPPRICRRLQRQLNTQLLCTQTQLRSISTLVGEMVSTGSQCQIITPPALPASLLSPAPAPAPAPSLPTIIPEPSTPSEPSETSAPPPNVIQDLIPPASSEPLAGEHTLEVDDNLDEGFCENQDGDDLDMERIMASIRRAGAYRKYGGDSASGATVFCRPRMRKKISRRKRVNDAT